VAGNERSRSAIHAAVVTLEVAGGRRGRGGDDDGEKAKGASVSSCLRCRCLKGQALSRVLGRDRSQGARVSPVDLKGTPRAAGHGASDARWVIPGPRNTLGAHQMARFPAARLSPHPRVLQTDGGLNARKWIFSPLAPPIFSLQPRTRPLDRQNAPSPSPSPPARVNNASRCGPALERASGRARARRRSRSTYVTESLCVSLSLSLSLSLRLIVISAFNLPL